MNNTVQNILVLIAVGLALAFIVKKFFWTTSKRKKACGSDDCGCH